MKNKLKSVKIEELERAYEKCLVYFYAFPNRVIGLNELSKSITSSKTATKQAVENLIYQDFIKRDIAGRSWLLSANQKHKYFLTKKVPYHLNKLYESGIVEFIYNLVPQARVIILFGSYRWGDDNEDSDIDIAVEVLGDRDMEIKNVGIIDQFGYRKKVPVNLHVFSRNKIELNLFSNIANGIILDGFLEVRI